MIIYPQKSKGFTLVELLVVVSIISILAAIGAVIFSNSQQGARDARRREEINAIANALEVKKGSSAIYSALANGDFADGLVPTDTTTAKYSVCYSTTGAAVNGTGYNPPTTWTGSSANPTAAIANCSGGLAWATISTSAPAASTTGWTICARLEGGGYYCRSNAQ